jgi:hypothetical protein
LSVVSDGCGKVVCNIQEQIYFWNSENRVLRRIFGPKRKRVKGDWRKLQNEELDSSGSK